MSEIFSGDVEYQVRMIVENIREETDSKIVQALLDVYMSNFIVGAEEELNLELGIVYATALILDSAPINIKRTLFESLGEAAVLLNIFNAGE